MPRTDLVTTSGTGHYRGQHSAEYLYRYKGDVIIQNPLSVIASAQATGPDNVPSYGSPLLGTNLTCQTIDARPENIDRKAWVLTVNFSPPPQGEDEEQQGEENPLQRAPVYDIGTVDKEWVVTKGWNSSKLGGTADPKPPIEETVTDREAQIDIVNTVLDLPDEPPIIDTDRNAVIMMTKNYEFLDPLMQLNVDYWRSTNKDTVKIGTMEFKPRQLRYMATRSGGLRSEVIPSTGEIQYYYPATTEIEITDSTDKEFNNVGYNYWDKNTAKRKKIVDDDGRDVVNPVNLDEDGQEIDGIHKIKWRYLILKDYQDVFFPGLETP